jgi:hypothetical protein
MSLRFNPQREEGGTSVEAAKGVCMSQSSEQWLFRTWMLPLFFTITSVAGFAANPDSTLFTTYNINTTGTSVSFTVCGSLPSSEGCYGSGTLGPFGKIGAMIEGNESVNLTLNTVTRSIYVLDIATGTSANAVILYIYHKTDTITSSFDTVSVSLFKTISLPIIGGMSARASMAANAGFVFIGTNQSPNAIVLKRGFYTFTGVGGFSPPINVAAITADRYGYVTVTYGTNEGSSGFIVFGPDGTSREDGGGAPFMLGTTQAFLPYTLP